MSMYVPKKLVDYKFSYPKRRLIKNIQEVNKENENIQEHQNIKQDSSNINQKMNMNQNEEEDFWVDCKK